MIEHALPRLISFYETLKPDSLDQLLSIYSEDAYFQDPFNEVHNNLAIKAIFLRMFDDLQHPRFTVLNSFSNGQEAMLLWTMSFSIKRWQPARQMTIHGTSHLRFDHDGRVCYHRDYWDAAHELYIHLPIIGGLLRFIKRRFA